MTTSTPEGSALLEAVLGSPHDPDPALVRADWLDEQGRHDEAALARLCCVFDTWTHSPRRKPAERPEMARLAAKVFFGNPDRSGLPPRVEYGLRFGVPVADLPSFETLARYADVVIAAGVRRVRVRSTRGYGRLSGLPVLLRLRHLDPGAMRLRSLHLRSLPAGLFARLVSLDLTLTRAGIRSLAELAPAMPALRRLCVRCPGVFIQDAFALLSRWPALEWAVLPCCRLWFTPRGRYTPLPRGLTRLGLHSNPSVVSGPLDYFVSELAGVRHLDLSGCSISPDQVRYLVRKSGELERVHVPGCGINPPELRALVREFGRRISW